MTEKTYSIKDKQELGKLLKMAREKKYPHDSKRSVANKMGIPNSTLNYFEDGVSVPAPDTYERMLEVLQPNSDDLISIETCYMQLKNTPPPDVCRTVINNSGLNEALRIVGNSKLSNAQITQIKDLLGSFEYKENCNDK